eukprot:3703532-Amphidinium_carterae.1
MRLGWKASCGTSVTSARKFTVCKSMDDRALSSASCVDVLIENLLRSLKEETIVSCRTSSDATSRRA